MGFIFVRRRETHLIAVVAIVLPVGIAIESYSAHGVPYMLRHPEVMMA